MRAPQLEWTQVFVTAVVTALLSFLVGVAVYHYSNRSPDLVYENFPPASFSNDTIDVGIYSAVLQNYGDREAEEVQFHLELSKNASLQDFKIEPSSPAIAFEVDATKAGSIEVRFPRLNPLEGARFTFLLDRADGGIEDISVRGKGIVGRSGPIEKTSLAIYIGWISGIFGVLLATAAWGFTSKISLESSLGELFRSQKRLAEVELRAVRTKGSEAVNIEGKILGSKYKLFYSPKSKRFKIMQFGGNGSILEGANNNEHSWRIKGTLLELLNSEGKPHSRFYFSVNDNAFFHTNDPDTGSIIKHNIKDQYMVPVD